MKKRSWIFGILGILGLALVLTAAHFIVNTNWPELFRSFHGIRA